MTNERRELHPAAHEERLAEAVARRGPPLDPATREALESCDVCRGELVELERLAAGLDRLGLDQRADVARSIERAGPAEEERVRRAFERAGLGGTTPAARRRRFWAGLGAVAATLAFGIGAWVLSPPDGTTTAEPILLESGGVHLLAPRGDVRDFSRFEWSGEMAPGWRATLVVRAFGPDGDVLKQTTVRSLHWEPPASLLAAWPDTIHCTLEIYDAAGEFVGSDSSSASRFSR